MHKASTTQKEGNGTIGQNKNFKKKKIKYPKYTIKGAPAPP